MRQEGSRLRAWLQIGSGLVLIGLIGAVTWNMLPMLMRPGEEVDGSTFTGTAEEGQLILALFALLIVFGCAATASGTYMIATGRKSRLLTGVAIGLASLLLAIGYAAKRAIG